MDQKEVTMITTKNKKYLLSHACKMGLNVGQFYEYIRDVDNDRVVVIDNTGEEEVYMKINFVCDVDDIPKRAKSVLGKPRHGQ